jgi:hypothetical protein
MSNFPVPIRSSQQISLRLLSVFLKDVPLANALGLKDSDGKPFQEGDTDNASSAISTALISNGCTN